MYIEWEECPRSQPDKIFVSSDRKINQPLRTENSTWEATWAEDIMKKKNERKSQKLQNPN